MENEFIEVLRDCYGMTCGGAFFGNGHINETFATDRSPRLVVQRINHRVFTDPAALMRNYEAVTKFLQEKIRLQGGDPARETLNLVYTKDGKSFAERNGCFYRAYRMVEGVFAIDQVEKAEQLEKAGQAFGHFQNLLADFPADTLAETIPHFHDTPARYRQLCDAVKNNAAGRLAEVSAELAFVEARKASLSAITDAIAAGTVPLRVTHNDTKINNVLFDEKTGKGLCVIDLDTVMPGSMLYDFGDAIRAGATTGAEDEPDLSKVNFSLPFYRAFREGFLSEVGGKMTEKERELLPAAARLMTMECGMRFLADYLNGDVYFRVHREKHNLDRARTQFKLVADMEKADAEMRK